MTASLNIDLPLTPRSMKKMFEANAKTCFRRRQGPHRLLKRSFAAGVFCLAAGPRTCAFWPQVFSFGFTWFLYCPSVFFSRPHLLLCCRRCLPLTTAVFLAADTFPSAAGAFLVGRRCFLLPSIFFLAAGTLFSAAAFVWQEMFPVGFLSLPFGRRHFRAARDDT